MITTVVGTIGRTSFTTRPSASGPVPRAARDGDARAARMAQFLGWCARRDLTVIDGLLETLRAVVTGELADASYGLDDVELRIDAIDVRIHDHIVDIDIEDNPDGIAYTHAELDDALRWWRDVIHGWLAAGERR